MNIRLDVRIPQPPEIVRASKGKWTNRVNEILGATGASSTSMDVDAMARAAIRGDYGNGDERKRRLGSYYSIVQRRVNEMLS